MKTYKVIILSNARRADIIARNVLPTGVEIWLDNFNKNSEFRKMIIEKEK